MLSRPEEVHLAHFAHRDHSFRVIVISHFGHHDRSGPTLGFEV
jgi:hypothetical protein